MFVVSRNGTRIHMTGITKKKTLAQSPLLQSLSAENEPFNRLAAALAQLTGPS